MLDSHLKTGLLPPTDDERDIKFGALRKALALPVHPQRFGHGPQMPQPRLMLGNGPDNSVPVNYAARKTGAGCCTAAMCGNAVRLLAGINGRPTPPIAGKETIDFYAEYTPYNVHTGENDNGADMRVALNHLRKVGIKDADGKRHKIGAFLLLNHQSSQEYADAMWIGDCVPTAIVMGDAQMDQFDRGQAWSPVGDEEDGHAILGDDLHGADLLCESWARDQRLTPAYRTQCIVQAFVIISQEQLDSGGRSPEHFDYAQLAQLMQDFS